MQGLGGGSWDFQVARLSFGPVRGEVGVVASASC